MLIQIEANYAQRIAFVVEIAARLHSYGTTAQRLEAAVRGLSAQLKLDCEPWSSPTGLILSFNDPSKPLGSSDTTRVVRLAPGENDLHKLSVADSVADAVTSGRMSIAQGHAALRALDQEPTRRARIMQVLSFGLAAAGLAGLWLLPWLDIAVAAITGLLIGLLDQCVQQHPVLKDSGEALSGLLAGAVVGIVAYAIAPLNLNTVIIAALVILLPGLALTNAINELSSQHWVSGTARLAGALTTVVKLAVGAIAAVTVMHMLGMEPQVRADRMPYVWMEWVWLLVASFAFTVSFKASRRDYPWVIAAAILGYLIARYAGASWGSPVSIFLSALTLTAAGNAFGRWVQRPGAIVRLPGTIMLVPGSASLRGLLTMVQQQDAVVGQSAMIAVANVLVAIVAGMLFGNILLPPRRNL
ncbi:MAG: threonine/serine exporter family protein [Xanthomonadaceae bacterium]|jgi:uncharacterized membrane protein YjjP (DUF1212 family)|nr:threonine/serine exporter family protein [Xanthomonadaceae bacterium]